MLFILYNSEDGLQCKQIERHQFDDWVKDHTDGLIPRHHPRFRGTIPDATTDTNEYFIIEGRAITPQPVTIVESYTLD